MFCLPHPIILAIVPNRVGSVSQNQMWKWSYNLVYLPLPEKTKTVILFLDICSSFMHSSCNANTWITYWKPKGKTWINRQEKLYMVCERHTHNIWVMWNSWRNKWSKKKQISNAYKSPVEVNIFVMGLLILKQGKLQAREIL